MGREMNSEFGSPVTNVLRGAVGVVGGGSKRPRFTTPGTRIRWSTLQDWAVAWAMINARAAGSRKHAQRVAHIEQLALNMQVVSRESDIETLAAVKLLIERGNMLPPRGMRAGHPATEILQRVGTVLNEQRRIVGTRNGRPGADAALWKIAA